MKGVRIAGVGAVSPAGWSVNSLRDALAKGQPLATRNLPRPGWIEPLNFRAVPAPTPRPEFLSHPRLRRASPVTQFAVGAAVEALGPDVAQVRKGSLRLGLVLCVMAGCVNYSRRFYDETLRDPATASPLVFPETVFNAPASHLAAVLGSRAISRTLVGDQSMFLVGLALAADWITHSSVDATLVVGAEESDWLVSDAFRRFERRIVLAEGAGALYLRPGLARGDIELTAVTQPHAFAAGLSRCQAAQAMRAELNVCGASQLLCDGTQHLPKLDAAETAAWDNWPGARLTPKPVLGEGLAAASSWQCVAAVDALRQGRHTSAVVSVVGCNLQAIGACFTRR